ncbi:sulfotransferase family 2 domain-containing protein [Paragemmobacter ruber]|uniref:Sulfotransferase family 2 domain-containing protein n=1 Tax=Paragemmobacter ruber TaxID=1985673 RepID=A0ABW9Y2T1_9RHOB|nr:sulfotransferase family 2 domain-containing protein [Rhodobacter ruber]NBE06539.1 sulfotransferase family 2 domain-containing protein [Rhodobacter ruber]
MMRPGASLFLGPETPPHYRKAVLDRLSKENPALFPRPDDAQSFLRAIHLPASLRWSFLNNGKAATSAARRFLFQIEFGTPLTTAWDVPQDINPDSVVHNLQGPSGVLRALIALPDPIETLGRSLRLVTVRHPVARAVSAFEYLCRSHDLAHSWFAQDRLRLNAVTGFDWTTDPRTATGFLKFLDYIQWMQAEGGRTSVNSHWRPQIDTILPALYRPDIVGRVEDMATFCRQVARHLDQPLPDGFALPRTNSQTYADRQDWLSTAARARLRTIYAADFDWLNYAPEDSPA